VDVDKVDRADYEDLSPAVLVESPRWGEAASLPLRVTGTANTFEAEFRLELKDSSGKVVADRQVMATSGSGTRGTFDAALSGTASPGTATLVAYTLSAQDGSRRNEAVVRVTL
jgi:germination protein M